MKKVLFLIGILIILVLSGCGLQEGGGILTPAEREEGILNIGLYDENGNLISQAIQPMAIVQDVPNVKYVQVNVGMRNEGNVELDASLHIFAPSAILKAIERNHIECNPSRDWIICNKILVEEKEKFFVSSGLIDVEDIGYGQHKLIAQAIATYIDEEGNKQEIGAKKEVILDIKRDPIRAGISVDIGTSQDVPPPPCKFLCPEGMIIRGLDVPLEFIVDVIVDGKTCYAKPIDEHGIAICINGVRFKDMCLAKPDKICMMT